MEKAAWEENRIEAKRRTWPLSCNQYEFGSMYNLELYPLEKPAPGKKMQA
jgi:hypothetical protein